MRVRRANPGRCIRSSGGAKKRGGGCKQEQRRAQEDDESFADSLERKLGPVPSRARDRFRSSTAVRGGESSSEEDGEPESSFYRCGCSAFGSRG